MLTVGALALAVIAPAPDQAEHGMDAVSTPLLALPATPELADHPLGAEIQRRQLGVSAPDTAQAPWNRLRELRFDAGFEAAPTRDGLATRAAEAERVTRAAGAGRVTRAAGAGRVTRAAAAGRVARAADIERVTRAVGGERVTGAVDAGRVSRVTPRRALTARPAARVRPSPVSRRPATFARQAVRPVEVRPAVRPAERPAVREIRAARTPATRPVRRQVAVQQRRVTMPDHQAVRRTAYSTTVRRLAPAGRSRNMRAVIAYAKAQVGKRYVHGGEGGSGFDCSGLTKRAYAKAGLSLPHSSGAQARRARSVSRSQARPGDLVVGRGHVGIYMGGGMMIDAGNSRTGVVYRKVYRGLSVSRLN